MGYEWLGTALDRLAGIEPYEVAQVLAAERRWPRPAVGMGTAGEVEVMAIWGRTRGGRALLVAVRKVVPGIG